MVKICLVASAGGDHTELLKLPEVWDGKDHFFVTTSEVVLGKLGNGTRAYAVPWANRNHPLLLLRMLVAWVNIMRKERPDVVISSGAAVGCLSGNSNLWGKNFSTESPPSINGQPIHEASPGPVRDRGR